MFDLASFREMQGLSGGQTNKDDEELRERIAPTGLWWWRASGFDRELADFIRFYEFLFQAPRWIRA
jgi:hypothetical protein